MEGLAEFVSKSFDNDKAAINNKAGEQPLALHSAPPSPAADEDDVRVTDSEDDMEDLIQRPIARATPASPLRLTSSPTPSSASSTSSVHFQGARNDDVQTTALDLKKPAGELPDKLLPLSLQRTTHIL